METLALLVGGGLLAVVFVLGLIALGVAATIWESWWLFPLWVPVMSPLGVPAISFWQFFALNMFVSVLLTALPQNDYTKEPNKSDRNASQMARMFFAFARPVLAYYLIRWAIA